MVKNNTSTYSPADRKLLHETFKAAKKHLATGSLSQPDLYFGGRWYNMHRFICWAIEDTKLSGVYIAKQLITNRLGCAFAEKWLRDVHGIHADELTMPKMQAWRHAWLDKLVEEFSV